MSLAESTGATLLGQHERTVDMLQEIKNDPDKTLAEMLWLLYDTQTTPEDLKQIAEIATRRQTKGY